MRARTFCKGSETLLFHLCALILCALVATGGDGGDPLVEECRRERDATYRSGGGGSGPAERAAALVSLGDELMRREKPGDAVVCYKLACSLEDGSRDAAGWRSLLMLGEAFEAAGEREEALIAFRNATQRTAGFSRGEMTSPWILTRRRYGLALEELGMPTSAIEQYTSVLRQHPTEIQSWYSAGYVHLTVGESNMAARHFRAALMLSESKFTIAAEGIGTIHFSDGRLYESLAYFLKAFKLQPDRPTTVQNLANSLGKIALDLNSSFLEQAVSTYVKVLHLDPQNADAANKLMLLRKQLCDWRNFDQDFDRLARGTAYQLGTGDRLSLAPFNALTLPFTPEDLLMINKAHSPASQPLPIQVDLTFPSRRINVGFLSADLRDHPVGRDLAVIFRALSTHANVHAYAINQFPREADSKDAKWLHSIASEVKSLTHVGNMGDLEAARAMVSNRLHVLVDVMGYTRGNRKGILAMQPAVVLVSFKGYMSTTGARYLTLLTDTSSSPPESSKTYSEPLAYMEQLFFISGHKDNHASVLQGVRNAYGSRVSNTLTNLGISDHHFVFCSFNALYKVDSRIFHTWMSILNATKENSILWLPQEPLEAKKNLCREAETRGVPCDRLVFSPQVPFDIHLQVKSRCDLALDTPLYNSHGTAADLLWAGVPLLSLPGEGMAARLASSILKAIGLPMLVAASLAEYERVALLLFSKPILLQAVRTKIENSRPSWVLHDYSLWARRFHLVLVLILDSGMSGRNMNIVGS